MKKEIIAVDLFCGAGGLTRGLLDAGIKVKKGYDIDPNLKETYEKNNEGTEFFQKDISILKGEEILKELDRANKFFLLAGCAPCQPFSIINKKNATGDKRKNLILEFARLIKETRPDFILMENVPGLKKTKGKLIFKKFEYILKKENYSYSSDILDARNYGVPQKRKRLILLASKHFKVRIPEPTHGPKCSTGEVYITVGEVISKYPKLLPGMKHRIISNHECRNLSDINIKRLKYIRKDGGLRDSLPKSLILKCHKDYKGHKDVYGRMKLNDTAPTLTCKCTSISNGRFAHPLQNRGISVREAAALQTFKDNYVFYGNL